MAIAVWSYAAWSARYPELAAWVAPDLAVQYWTEATIYLDNTDASVVADAGIRGIILNAITAHIAALDGPIGGVEPSALVGRINSVSEGSVSVSSEMPTLPGPAAWFSQSRYGLSAWQMMAPYRTFR